MKEQMAIRVNDIHDLHNLNNALNEGWRIVNAYTMPFEGVVPRSSLTWIKDLGGYMYFILEKEADEKGELI